MVRRERVKKDTRERKTTGKVLKLTFFYFTGPTGNQSSNLTSHSKDYQFVLAGM